MFRSGNPRGITLIVAKQKFGPQEHGTWYKIRNREYSQMVGREELFELDRHSEPVPGSAAAPAPLVRICARFASLISAISSRSFLIRSDTDLGINDFAKCQLHL
jgi:hypothetical protein